MVNAARLSKREVAELTGRSERWVEQNRERLDAAAVGRASNGREDLRYSLAALPPEAQAVWAERQRQKIVEIPAKDPAQLTLGLTAPVGANLSEGDRAEAARRFGAIEPIVTPRKFELLQVQCPTRGQLVEYLCAEHKVRPRTLYNWLTAWRRGGLPALVSRDRSDKGRPRAMTPAAFDFLLAAAMPQRGVYGVLSVAEIFRAYEEERVWRAAHANKPMDDFGRSKYARYLDEDGRLRESAQLPPVSCKTFRTWFNRIPEVARVMAREGGEAYRNSQEVLSFRDLAAVQPLDYVVMDHRVLDIFCLVPKRGGWKLARPWLTAAIDMRTRKWLAWAIVETPSSASIAAVLKRTFLDHGLPASVYWDNGKDFRCEWLEGGRLKAAPRAPAGELETTWRGALGTLGIRVHHAIVRNARAKLIEPNFGRVSGFDRTLPEWCGHKPGARPERFGKLLKEHEAWLDGRRETTPFRTIGQVAALYNKALEMLNERELEGEGMQKATPTGRGWMCPNEAWEVLIRHVERRTVDADLLKFCFAKRRELTVKHGEVKTSFCGRDYHYRLTGNAVALMALNGQTVDFAYDPLDLGEAAIYYRDRFVGLASCVELRQMGEDAFVEDEKNRRRSRREVKRFIEAVHQAVPVPSPETRLERRRAVAPTREGALRAESPAEMPAAIVEAEAATRAARDFSFDDAPEAGLVAKPAPAAGDDDGEFRFFQGE